MKIIATSIIDIMEYLNISISYARNSTLKPKNVSERRKKIRKNKYRQAVWHIFW